MGNTRIRECMDWTFKSKSSSFSRYLCSCVVRRTQVGMLPNRVNSEAINVAYAAQGRGIHIVLPGFWSRCNNYRDLYCNYCKKWGQEIKEWPIRPQNRKLHVFKMLCKLLWSNRPISVNLHLTHEMVHQISWL